MKIKTLILGFGITGESCLKYLNSLNKTCRIFDTRTKDELKNIKQYTNTKNEFYFSEYNDEILKEIDTVIISPGFEPNHPLISQICYKGIPIQTDIDLFKSSYDGKIISVTGTNGKTTVVQMLEKILISLGKKARACGNNGVPPLNLINEKLDYAIVELSSYQLEYMVDKSSDISILLNITDDHLDRHETFERYSKIKMGIFDNIGKINIPNPPHAVTRPAALLLFSFGKCFEIIGVRMVPAAPAKPKPTNKPRLICSHIPET